MYSRNTANGRGRGIIPPYNYGGTVYSRALREVQDGSRPQGMVRDEVARRAGSGAGTDVGSAQQNIGGVRTVRADSAHPVGTNGMNSVGRGIPDGAASARTVMHVGGRPDGDYPPRSYPDVLGRGGRPTGGEAPRPVRHGDPSAQQSLPDLGALLGALPPSDDILLIFLLVTLMSARSEGRRGDDLLIAIIALLLLGGR